MESILTVALVVLLVGVGSVVATVFRGGAPTGESSARADINASEAGHGTEQMDSLRNKQGR